MEKIEFENRLTAEMPSLKVFARRFTRDHDDSEDLIQETSLKALQFRDSFRKGTNFKGWLYTIMRNTFITSCIPKGIRRLETMKAGDLSSEQLLWSAARNSGESGIIMDDIRTAVSRLGGNLQIVFTLYCDGYKYHEIAGHLSIPIGTVKNQIHLARKLLRRALEPYHFYKATA